MKRFFIRYAQVLCAISLPLILLMLILDWPHQFHSVFSYKFWGDLRIELIAVPLAAVVITAASLLERRHGRP